MRKATSLVGTTAIIALVLMLSLGACGRAPEPAAAAVDTPVPPTVTPEPAPISDPASASPLPPADSILEASVEAIKARESWHYDMAVHMTVYSRGLALEVPLSYVGDFRAPNRMEGIASLKVLGATVEKPTVLTSRIMEGAEPGSGVGVATVKPVTAFSLLEFAGLEVSKVKNLEVVGEETLDGLEVYHLKGAVPVQDVEIAPGGIKLVLRGDVRFEVWIGVDDSLPWRGVGEADLTATRAVTGAKEGSLYVTGTATFSDYGQPVTSAPQEQTISLAASLSCDASKGFAAYNSEKEAIRFCYPSGWVVDNLMDSCAYISVSPTGVAPGRPVPSCLVVLYPDQTITTFSQSAAGAVEVSGRTALCFIRYVTNAVLKGDPKSIFSPQLSAEEQAARRNDPLAVTITGIQYGDEKSVSLDGALVEASCRPTVDQITFSTVVGKPDGR